MAERSEQRSEQGRSPTMVRCAVCKRLIPASEAISPEGRQYVLHLCGGACHAQWERECAESLEREFEARSGVKRD